ncbi:MAG: tRNA (adenosine(37)-N6)-threonylcarbamoyltransferase complex dimerization subunit type 1 TsaB [Saprospiraceae bacterium]|nr:tRNA (adenosine(37)-N6)-threonylcarbamoyltransferase complex dimerization subunit type 1 TsaB [Saprospiraceae bacterium]
MANILAIECTSFEYSIAISNDNKLLIQKIYENSNPVQYLTIHIQETLHASGLQIKDLSAIAINTGPGSYTSLRAGISIVKGIVSGYNLPLIAIEKDFILYNMISNSRGSVVTVIMARKGQFLISAFEASGNELFRNQIHLEADKLMVEKFGSEVQIIGEGLNNLITDREISDLQRIETRIKASDLLDIAYKQYTEAKFVTNLELLPKYLFEPMITQAKKRLQY